MIYSDGSVYQGGWKDGMHHGKGKKKNYQGPSYDGYWLNDMKHGYGEEIWPDNSEFKGNF